MAADENNFFFLQDWILKKKYQQFNNNKLESSVILDETSWKNVSCELFHFSRKGKDFILELLVIIRTMIFF